MQSRNTERKKYRKNAKKRRKRNFISSSFSLVRLFIYVFPLCNLCALCVL